MITENETIDLKELFYLLKKNMFFITIFAILFGTIAGFYSEYTIDKKYRSETTIYIKPFYTGADNGLNYNDILVTHNLVKTYSVIAKSDRVLSRVVEELNLSNDYNMSEKNVRNILSINSVNDTEVISISVTSTDPELSAIISNKIGEVFIEEIPKIMIDENEDNDEIYDGVNTNITLSLIDKAEANYFPVSPNIKLNITIGFVLGVMLSVGIVLLRSYFDRTIRTPKDVEKYFDIPIIGMIPDQTPFVKNGKNSYKKLITIDMPNSVISEIYRQVRTNIDFIDIKSINITSTLPFEAKTITISNLANVFAASKKTVLLIDADIRKPKIHHIFKMKKEQGLTDLLLLQQQSQFNKEIISQEYKYYIKSTEVENLKVITSGSKVSNPSELLNSKEFNDLIKFTRDISDIVLIDCPPIGVVTDASIVSQVCDGTLFVIQSNRNSYEAVSGALNRLKGVGTNNLGVILTMVDVSNTKEYQEYGFHGYNYEYYRDDEYSKKQSLFSKFLNKIIRTK